MEAIKNHCQNEITQISSSLRPRRNVLILVFLGNLNNSIDPITLLLELMFDIVVSVGIFCSMAKAIAANVL